MNYHARAAAVVAALTLIGACARGESDTMDMTPEEHARMLAGGATPPPSADGGGDQPVHLTSAEERALGVEYATVVRETVVRSVRTVANILAPEPGVVDVTLKIEGFVERLHVATTGESVRRGQPLLEIYSPMLVAAQEELLTARRLVQSVDPAATEARRNAEATLTAARRRLAYWDVAESQIARLEETGQVTKTLTLVAPAGGVVLEKDVFEGQRVMPGMRLYRLADLSQVWVEGEIYEQDLRYIRRGTPVHIEVQAYPGDHVMGAVAFVYPVVDEGTRTARVRVQVPNPAGRLKPGMFATLFLDVEVGRDALTIPVDAVLATGERNMVFVQGEDGGLVPRPVVVGDRAGGRIVILSGLDEGERVVAAANFLVDAESRLRVGAGAMPGHQHDAASGSPPPPPAPEHQHD
jgi:Cu(I)/Ag(I) efflux system membrane fusion protein